MTRVLYLHPPNFAAINRAFNVRGKRVIYAYGDRIYNPQRITVPPELVVHEQVHQRRQGDDPETWWERYIAEPAFRLGEEIPAHWAELRHLRDYGRAEGALDRVAGRLASPLYGSLLTLAEARRALSGAVEASVSTAHTMNAGAEVAVGAM